MRLFKAHGLGNDYLVLESGETLDEDIVRALCDRNRGPGGDGILQPVPAQAGEHGLVIWNPDGSRAEKSGNGLRIFAWWLTAEQGAGERLSIRVGGERVAALVDGQRAEIEMGVARFEPPYVPLAQSVSVSGVRLPVCLVNLGNPHCVIFRDEPDLDTLPWRIWGEQIEKLPLFINRTNVQFARCDPDAVELRIWERGAGPTLASGSSACAAAAAAVREGRKEPGKLRVRMPGGELWVTVREDGSLLLDGPVAPVGRFLVDTRWKP